MSTPNVENLPDLALLLLTATIKESVFRLHSRGTLPDVPLMGSLDVATVVNARLTPKRLVLPRFLQERMSGQTL